MAKIFRLHSGASNVNADWATTQPVGAAFIDSIKDPNGATANHEVTSIPSPFAIFDLTKQAFKYVTQNGIDGTTIYHKIVSNTLDVGEIFYNLSTYQNDFGIIRWDKNIFLANLQNNPGQASGLGNTLQLYLTQDAEQYNFNQMNDLFFLNYKGKGAPTPMNIVGSTSPTTVFACPANDLSYVDIQIGNTRFFDNRYESLAERDQNYILFWYALQAAMPRFHQYFPEVNDYLNEVRRHPSVSKILQKINSVSANTYNGAYETIQDTAGVSVNILGFDLKKEPSPTVPNNCDFFIAATRPVQGLCPLVLPYGTFTKPWHYVRSNWSQTINVPVQDPNGLSVRLLPQGRIQHPYLTIGDFLEDTIVKNDNTISSEYFFNGNDAAATGSKGSYLLPLKPLFFDYFTADDLRNKYVGGKPMLEIRRQAANSVRVTLRIPVVHQTNGANDYIEYQRTYFDATTQNENDGRVVKDKEFAIYSFPHYKYAANQKPYYRVSLLDRNSAGGQLNTYALAFFNDDNQRLVVDAPIYRNRINQQRIDPMTIDSATYGLDEAYQYLQVTNANDPMVRGIIVPILNATHAHDVYRFAVDFGTTNTHIEYVVNGGQTPKAFELSTPILYTDMDGYLSDVVQEDFVPNQIATGGMFHYPMRTVLAEMKGINWNQAVETFKHTNIPFTYEKKDSLHYNTLSTDLKWSIDTLGNQRAQKYIENLLVLLRTKVLQDGGDVSKTEIYWTYPLSMTAGRLARLKKVWNDTFNALFAPSTLGQIQAISESYAPYVWHQQASALMGLSVCVDIGGGTTDVLFTDSNKGARGITSFRFAANNIWGDGYAINAASNGFVKKYKGELREQLSSNGLTDLAGFLDGVVEKNVSTDIMAFFFSLEQNKAVREKRISISLADKINSDQRGGYVVLLFYGAVLYHIVQIMKAKGWEMPRNIIFSGNGAKALRILGDEEILGNFTQRFIEHVWGEKYATTARFDVLLPQDSKQATAKGGCLFSSQDVVNQSTLSANKEVLLGTDAQTILQLAAGAAPKALTEITNTEKTQVVAEVRNYIDALFALNREFSFADFFGLDVTLLDQVKAEVKSDDLKDYLDFGINQMKTQAQAMGVDANLEETLFFYPLVGALNAVAREIYNWKI